MPSPEARLEGVRDIFMTWWHTSCRDCHCRSACYDSDVLNESEKHAWGEKSQTNMFWCHLLPGWFQILALYAAVLVELILNGEVES